MAGNLGTDREAWGGFGASQDGYMHERPEAGFCRDGRPGEPETLRSAQRLLVRPPDRFDAALTGWTTVSPGCRKARFAAKSWANHGSEKGTSSSQRKVSLSGRACDCINCVACSDSVTSG
jgi:hypothetical protein